MSPSATLSVGDAVAAAAGAGTPIVIQDYPAGSGVRLAVDDLVAAARGEPLVVGVKAEAPPTSGTIEGAPTGLPRTSARSAGWAGPS